MSILDVFGLLLGSITSLFWPQNSRLVVFIVVTGKNNRFPILDILGVFNEYPQKSQIWQSETSPNQRIPNQVPGTCLNLPIFGIFVGIL